MPSFPLFLDTGMLTKNVNALYGGSPQTYASNLATRITVTAYSPLSFLLTCPDDRRWVYDYCNKSQGQYASLAAGWVSSMTQSALSSTAVPLTWAQESNAFDCVSSQLRLPPGLVGHRVGILTHCAL